MGKNSLTSTVSFGRCAAVCRRCRFLIQCCNSRLEEPPELSTSCWSIELIAIYLRRTQPSSRFFNAAVDVMLPTPTEEDKAQRRELLASAGTERPPTAKGPKHLPTEDGANVGDTLFALKTALTASGRPEDNKMRPILEAMLAPESRVSA